MEEKQTFYEWLGNLVEPFRNWLIENHSNPFLWVGLFLLGLVIFGVGYNALHKDK